MSTIFEVVVREFLWMAFVHIGAFLVRKQSAAVRHRVYALGLLGLFVLPVLMLKLPSLDVPRPTSTYHWEPAIVTTNLSPVPMAPPSPQPAPLATTSPETQTVDWERVGAVGVGIVWFVGCTVCLLPLLLQLWRVRQLLRLGKEVALDKGYGLPSRARLLEIPLLPVAMTFGHLRPTICVPPGFSDMDIESRCAVMLHEGAHVRRADWAWIVFARFVVASCWFNPLAWWAERMLRVESEHAADDEVLRAGIAATNYAELLVDLAAAINGRRCATVSLPIIDKATLKARVQGILATTRPRGAMSRPLALVGVVLALAVALPLAMAHLVPGPVVTSDGILSLSDGKHIEIVAITDMRGDQAISWNMKGEMLPRAYLVGANERKYLGFANSPSALHDRVRYLFIRSNSDDYNSFSDRPEGKEWPTMPYTGFDVGGYFMNAAGVGGINLRVVQIVVPKGTSSASISTTVPRGDWRLDASSEYNNGRLVNGSKAIPGIELVPSESSVSVSWAVPAESRGRSVRLDVDPDASVTVANGLTEIGRQVNVPMSEIRSVKVYSCLSQTATMIGIPMEPTRGAKYHPTSLIPPGLIVAKAGKAVLPDGQTVILDQATVFHSRREKSVSDKDLDKINARRWHVAFRQPTPNGLIGREWEFYDSEGRSLDLLGTTIIWNPDHQVRGVGVVVPKSISKMDVLVRIPIGEFKTAVRGDLNRTPGFRSWIAKTEWHDMLSVQYPKSVVDRLAETDYRMLPLDKNGREIQCSTYSTMDTTSTLIGLSGRPQDVKSIEFQSRPKQWVLFRDVPVAETGR